MEGNSCDESMRVTGPTRAMRLKAFGTARHGGLRGLESVDVQRGVC